MWSPGLRPPLGTGKGLLARELALFGSYDVNKPQGWLSAWEWPPFVMRWVTWPRRDSSLGPHGAPHVWTERSFPSQRNVDAMTTGRTQSAHAAEVSSCSLSSVTKAQDTAASPARDVSARMSQTGQAGWLLPVRRWKSRLPTCLPAHHQPTLWLFLRETFSMGRTAGHCNSTSSSAVTHA